MLFFATMALSFFILEITIRIISPPSIFHPALPLRPKNKMQLYVNLKGLSPVAIHSTNKWGLRGDEPPSDWENYYTIITVGGSSTQCFYLDDHKTWPYLLQEKLKKKYPKVWVGNGGLDGQTTRAHIIFMQYVIAKVKPKAIIFLTGLNDLLLSFNEDNRLYGLLFERAHWKYWIFAHSRLIQVLYIWKKIIFNHVTVVKEIGHGNYKPKLLIKKEDHLPTDLTTLLPSLEEYHQNIRKIIEMARLLNVRIIFLNQPMLFDDTPYWRQVEGQFYWLNNKYILSAATYWKLLEIFNKELLETCFLENVEYIDLASLIPHNELYFYDSVHFTEKGAELVAQKIADFLLLNLR